MDASSVTKLSHVSICNNKYLKFGILYFMKYQKAINFYIPI